MMDSVMITKRSIRAMMKLVDLLLLRLWLIRLIIGNRICGGHYQVRQITRAPARYFIAILRRLGARVNDSVTIKPGIIFDNIGSGLSGLQIEEKAYIGPGVFLDLATSISIAAEVVLSPQAMLLTHGDVGDRYLAQYIHRSEGPIVLKKGCWIGARAVILPGVTIGTGSVVGAGAIVTTDVPDFTMVVGVPAREMRKIR
jgi:acetyltransferase-like isoleucine patch superfamily enzyme